MNYDQLITAAAAIARETGRESHDVAVVLGSGLGDYAASLAGAIEVSYATIPDFPQTAVEGHAGSLFSADVGDGVRVLLFAGRVHTYEGWDLDEVVFGVRTAALCGCRNVLLTNAAGGAGAGMEPGDHTCISNFTSLTTSSFHPHL